MNGTLIMFTRFPQPGQTKTRLAPRLGHERAANLHRVLVEHTLATVQAAAAVMGLVLEIHHTGNQAEMAAWLGTHMNYRPQVAGDLGGRMATALELAAGPTVLVGTDCPDLSVGILAAAFAVLKEQDVVLGPATDGGYYLVGAREQAPDIFARVTWGSDQVLAQTRNKLTTAKMTWAEVATLSDIDRPEDLALLPDHLVPPEPN